MAKKKLIFYIVLAIVILFIFFPGFIKHQKLLHEKRTLQAKIKELEETNKRLEEEKIKLESDIEYIENRSLRTDLQILWKTATSVLAGKGAQ